MKIIESLPEDRWQEYKDIKLASIKNEPIAFSESYEKLENKDEKDWKKELSNAKEDKTVTIFVEDDNQKLIAFASAHVHTNDRLSHNAFLSNLYVDKGFRNKGLGKQLVEKRIEVLKERYPRITNIHCEIVTTQKTSINIHKELGFTISGEIKNLFMIDGVPYSEYWMQKEI